MFRFRSFGVIMGFALVVGQSLPAQPVRAQDPVPSGILTAWRGDIQLVPAEGTRERRLELGVSLFEGDSLRLPPGAHVLVLFRSGRLLRTARSVEIREGTMRGDPSAQFSALERSVRSARAGRRPVFGGGRRDEGGISILQPNRIVVSGAPVEVRWALLDPIEGDRTVAWEWPGGADSVVIAGDRYRIESLTAPPGSEVRLTVRVAGNAIAARTSFRIADLVLLDRVEAFREQLEAAGDGSEAETGIAMALLLHGLGLSADVLPLLDAPDVAGAWATEPQYHYLRARTLERLGRIEEARAALDRAIALEG